MAGLGLAPTLSMLSRPGAASGPDNPPTSPTLFGGLSTGSNAVGVPESTAAGTLLALVTATSPGDILTVSIASDPAGVLFVDRTDNWELRLNWVRLNNAATPSYSASIKIQGLQGSVNLPITINVTAATNPGQLSSTTGTNLVPAMALDTRLGLTAQYGATMGTAQLQNGAVVAPGVGPCGQDAIDVSTPTSFINFATNSPANTAYTAFWVTHIVTKASHFAYGLSTQNGSNYIQCNGSASLNRIDKVTVSGVASTVTTVRPMTMGRYQMNCITWDSASGVANWYVDDMSTPVKTISAVALGGTQTFNQLCKAGSNTPPTAPRFIFAAYLYNVVLNATDRASLQAWHEPERRMKIYVSQSLGADATTNCCSAATPYKTMVGSINLADGARPGDWFVLQDDDVWSDDQINQPSACSGISGAHVRITRSFTGTNRPLLRGRFLTGATWVNTTGDQWTTAVPVAADPRLILWSQGGSGVPGSDNEWFRLADQTGSTITAHGQYSYLLSVLTIDLGPGVDPNTQTLQVVLQPVSGNGRLYTGNGTYTTLTDLSFRYGYGEAFFPGGSAAEIYCKRSELAWGSNDGFDCSGSPTNIIYGFDLTIIGNGRSYGTVVGNAGEGDGCSGHGQGAYVIKRSVIAANTTGGIRSEQYVTETVEQCIIRGNLNSDIIVLSQSSGGSAGVKAYRNNLILSSANTTGVAVQVQSVATNVTLTAENNTIVNLNGSAATAMAWGAGVTAAANYNITYGFTNGALTASGSTTTAAYNNIFNCGATPVTGVTDTNRVAGDPLFVNPASNWHLQAGSPAVNAAVGSATLVDADSRQRPYQSVNDIGCFEWAA